MGSLVGCRLWGRTESDTTEATQQQQQQPMLFIRTDTAKIISYAKIWFSTNIYCGCFRWPDQVFLFALKISSLEDLTSEEMKSKQGLSLYPSAWPVAISTFYRHEEKEVF